MRVALLQFAAGLDPDANLATLRRLSADCDADLFVAPEAAMHDFGPPDLPLGPVAEALDGPFVAGLGTLAAERGAAFVAGMFEVSDDPGRPYNTLVLTDASGDLVATYRKTHLYDSFGYAESERLSQGDPVPVVAEAGGVRIGLMTCYDLRFPEHARALVDAGADALVVPAAWVRGPLKESHWETLLRARAIENTAYVAAAAQCGRQYCGRSMLIDPLGVPLAGLSEGEGVATGSVSLDRIHDVRKTNPALTHRRWTVAPSPEIVPSATG